MKTIRDKNGIVRGFELPPLDVYEDTQLDDWIDKEVEKNMEIIRNDLKVRGFEASPEFYNKNTTSLKSFHYLENGKIDFSILETKYSTKVLDAGVYNITCIHNGNEWVVDLKTTNDKENFSDDLGFYYEDKIKNVYSKFFLPEIKQKVNSLGYNHKAGILLYGKQGTGKTSMFKKYFNDAVINHKALVFDVKITEKTERWWDFLQQVRKIQDNPIIVFLDEFDEYFGGRYEQETQIKKILDGTDSIDNCLFFMTTNYIDDIPETIKNRPSRVKYKIEVTGIQDEKLIEKFLKQSFDKVNMKTDYKKDISQMKGWTIDELKQYVLDKIMDIEPEQKDNRKIGF